MAKRIYKYPFAISPDYQHLPLGDEFMVLHVGLDGNGAPALWAVVETDDPVPNDRDHQSRVIVVGTEYPADEGRYRPRPVGTFTQGQFVWHVFIMPSVAGMAKADAEQAQHEARQAEFMRQLRDGAMLDETAAPVDGGDAPADAKQTEQAA